MIRILLAAGSFAAAVAAQWAPFTTSVAPPAQSDPAMVFDLLRNEVLLHGTVANTPETWAYAAGTWTRKTPAQEPGPRRYAGMAYDVLLGQAILYGGQGPGGATPTPNLDDTWAFDGSNWTQLWPTLTPGGRAHFGIAYDLQRQRTVIYGGSPNPFFPTLAADTWEFDGTNWTQVATPGTSTAGARERMAMCYMASLQRTVLFGGWDQQQVTTTFDDTWTWDGSQWQQVQVAGPRPAPRVDARLVDDLQRGVCVLCGGMDPVSMVIFNDTWEFDGASWRQVSVGPSPPRNAFGMVFDMVRGRPVLFGGRTASLELRDDTWEYGASYKSYGYGCQGRFGVPLLTGVLPPRIGRICHSRLSNLDPAAGVAIIVVGMSRTSWPFGSLPASLAGYGMPGCVAYANPELFTVVVNNGGVADWQWQVPNAPGLFQVAFYQQGLSLDAAANAAGLVTSNAGAAVLGW